MFLTRRFYIVALPIVLLLLGGYFWSPLYGVGNVLLCIYSFVALLDVVLLFTGGKIKASRHCADRFSNGDENKVKIPISSSYPFKVNITVMDEAPFIFQRRDIDYHLSLEKKGEGMVQYTLRPTKRGVYNFGRIRVFTRTVIGMVERRFTQGEPTDVKVYPSYLMLSRYELLAMSNNLNELGIKRIRKVAQQTDFEQIRDYVQGDEYRSINWKATARRNSLMVNVYQDERSQPIYNLIDKGRVMQQTFGGMTLLDYAINATLVLSHIAIRKDDKAGLITYNNHLDTFVPAGKSKKQMQTIMDTLYAQETAFSESDYSELCVQVEKHLHKRSLLIVYTNFSDLGALNRELPYLRQLSKKHCILAVLFEDADLKTYLREQPMHTEAYYQQVIGEKFAYEKRLIVNTLRQNGIYALLTAPEALTINVINKYLEMKARQLI